MTKLEELKTAGSAITCVKPLVMNLSLQLMSNVSGGIHPYYSTYYTRNVRGSEENPND